jgi:hypothetical protein
MLTIVQPDSGSAARDCWHSFDCGPYFGTGNATTGFEDSRLDSFVRNLRMGKTQI